VPLAGVGERGTGGLAAQLTHCGAAVEVTSHRLGETEVELAGAVRRLTPGAAAHRPSGSGRTALLHYEIFETLCDIRTGRFAYSSTARVRTVLLRRVSRLGADHDPSPLA
jgi:hypothetical protein